jgi:hypothetical protein
MESTSFSPFLYSDYRRSSMMATLSILPRRLQPSPPVLGEIAHLPDLLSLPFLLWFDTPTVTRLSPPRDLAAGRFPVTPGRRTATSTFPMSSCFYRTLPRILVRPQSPGASTTCRQRPSPSPRKVATSAPFWPLPGPPVSLCGLHLSC